MNISRSRLGAGFLYIKYIEKYYKNWYKRNKHARFAFI